MTLRKATIPALLVSLLLVSGCIETRSRVAAGSSNTSFFIETTLSKPGFGGSAIHIVEINVDNAKLAEHRPLSVADLNFVKADDRSDDLTKLEGFLWYFPTDGKVLIGIGHRSLKADERTISPFVVGEFPIQKQTR